jgi:hypothetical protein
MALPVLTKVVDHIPTKAVGMWQMRRMRVGMDDFPCLMIRWLTGRRVDEADEGCEYISKAWDSVEKETQLMRWSMREEYASAPRQTKRAHALRPALSLRHIRPTDAG